MASKLIPPEKKKKKRYHGSHRAYDHDTTTQQGVSVTPGTVPDDLKSQSSRMSSNTTKARDGGSCLLTRATWGRNTAGKVFRLRRRKADIKKTIIREFHGANLNLLPKQVTRATSTQVSVSHPSINR